MGGERVNLVQQHPGQPCPIRAQISPPRGIVPAQGCLVVSSARESFALDASVSDVGDISPACYVSLGIAGELLYATARQPTTVLNSSRGAPVTVPQKMQPVSHR